MKGRQGKNRHRKSIESIKEKKNTKRKLETTRVTLQKGREKAGKG